jgi:hypothetical protein
MPSTAKLDTKSGISRLSNNLWKIAVTADLDRDGTPDLAVGGQNGFMHVLSGKDGKLL